MVLKIRLNALSIAKSSIATKSNTYGKYSRNKSTVFGSWVQYCFTHQAECPGFELFTGTLSEGHISSVQIVHCNGVLLIIAVGNTIKPEIVRK